MVTLKIKVDISKYKQAALTELEACAYELLGRSQALCPVEHNTLRGSGKVVRKGNGFQVGYGGSASDYAEIQHENLHYHHTVGQAKFLEQPFDEMKEEIIKRVANAIKGA